MAIKLLNGKYACGYCHKQYSKPPEADACKDSHNLIYLALSEEDLNRLVNFIYLKEDKLLSDDLVDRLQSYLKASFNFNLGKK